MSGGPDTPVYTFDFHQSASTREVFDEISIETGYSPDTKEFNQNINERLLFTLHDPFYEEFREIKKYDEFIINKLNEKYKD